MIRREIRLVDGAAGWLFISQVEHARVSAELASHCIGRFGAATSKRAGPSPAPTTSPSPAPVSVCNEVLSAIRRHDDGWTLWEQTPRLDADAGRPLTFTEIEPAEAVDIWSRSVNVAEAIGPLAAWMVAGHFLRLAQRSDAERPAHEIQTWRLRMDERRNAWLAAWRQHDQLRHTEDVAQEALQWLWTFDEVSLWLCCTCLANEPIPCAPEPYRAGRATPIEMELAAVGGEAATAQPWRFAADGITVMIAGRAVRAGRYGNSAEVLAASAPQTLTWRLLR
jgi:hypothetical protein